jgi:periplasmic protein TonB
MDYFTKCISYYNQRWVLIKQLFIHPQNSKVMKNEMILKSSLLDILFDRRNKEYGAYQLRKNYPQRLKKALFATILLSVSLLLLLTSFKSSHKNNIADNEEGVMHKLPPVTQDKPKEEPKKEPEKVQPKGNQTKVLKSVEVNQIKLVDDRVAPPASPTETGSPNGNTTDPNEGNTTGQIGTPKGKDTIIPEVVVKPVEPIINPLEVINEPDVEAHYPGGRAALAQFFQDKLGDEVLEEGVPKKVTLSFIVELDGSISDIKILAGSDHDFNKSAEKAVAKMKKWNPAKYQKRFVRTFHEMPITILPNEQ